MRSRVFAGVMDCCRESCHGGVLYNVCILLLYRDGGGGGVVSDGDGGDGDGGGDLDGGGGGGVRWGGGRSHATMKVDFDDCLIRPVMLLIYGTYDQVLLVITEGVSAVAASSFSRLVVVGDHRNRKLKLLCRTSRPIENVLAAHSPRVRQVNGMMKSSGCFRAKKLVLYF